MSSLGVLKQIEGDMAREVEHWHPWLLVQRFATAFAPLFLGLLASNGWRPSWAQLWALLPGVLAASAERVWKSAPWSALLAVGRDAQDAAPRPTASVPIVSTPTLQVPKSAP